ncbi:MAG: hypothetical protein ABMB14_35480 [Myxococcota bacterium]
MTEGASDAMLARILESLCVRAGAREAVVRWVDFGRLGVRPGHTVVEKVRGALGAYSDVNLTFVHRDADGPSPTARRAEIADAGVALRSATLVPVVPIQETEAWILVSGEDAIRAAAGQPRGRGTLAVPRPGAIEERARPKELLQRLVDDAQIDLPRRHRPPFAVVRRLLLERLDPDGPIRDVPAFRQLRDDIAAAIDRLR